MASSYPPLFDDVDTLDPTEFHQRFKTYKPAPPSSICTFSSTDRLLPSSSIRTPSSPDTSLPSSYIDTPTSPYTPSSPYTSLSFTDTPLIVDSDFEKYFNQNSVGTSSIRTSSSPYIFLSSSSAHTLPSLDTPPSSSSTNISLQPSRETQIKCAVNQALSNGTEDSTWSYDNESFIKLSAKWGRIRNGNFLSKAFVLLDDYLGIDEDGSTSWPSFFYKTRNHYEAVEQLKMQYEQGDIKTVLDLLEKLIAIKRDPEGLLQTIIAVIASKMFPDLIPPAKSADLEDMFLNLSMF